LGKPISAQWALAINSPILAATSNPLRNEVRMNERTAATTNIPKIEQARWISASKRLTQIDFAIHLGRLVGAQLARSTNNAKDELKVTHNSADERGL
jgi:hypothetical protein